MFVAQTVIHAQINISGVCDMIRIWQYRH